MSIFKKIINKELPSHILFEDENFITILDIYPNAKGHFLLIPKLEVPHLDQLPQEILLKLGPILARMGKALKKALNVTQYKVVQNNGAWAGQSIFHVHFHFIPFYSENQKLNIIEFNDAEAAIIIEKFKGALETGIDN